MKKIIMLVAVLALSSGLYAVGDGQGTAAMSNVPAVLAPAMTGVKISVTYTAGTQAWASGVLYFYRPYQGSSAFSVTPGDPGYITGKANSNYGLNIQTDGKSATISVQALTASSGTIIFRYGDLTGGGAGATMMSTTGTFTWAVYSAPTGGPGAAIAAQPTIVVVALTPTITQTITQTSTLTITPTITSTLTVNATLTVQAQITLTQIYRKTAVAPTATATNTLTSAKMTETAAQVVVQTAIANYNATQTVTSIPYITATQKANQTATAVAATSTAVMVAAQTAVIATWTAIAAQTQTGPQKTATAAAALTQTVIVPTYQAIATQAAQTATAIIGGTQTAIATLEANGIASATAQANATGTVVAATKTAIMTQTMCYVATQGWTSTATATPVRGTGQVLPQRVTVNAGDSISSAQIKMQYRAQSAFKGGTIKIGWPSGFPTPSNSFTDASYANVSCESGVTDGITYSGGYLYVTLNAMPAGGYVDYSYQLLTWNIAPGTYTWPWYDANLSRDTSLVSAIKTPVVIVILSATITPTITQTVTATVTPTTIIPGAQFNYHAAVVVSNVPVYIQKVTIANLAAASGRSLSFFNCANASDASASTYAFSITPASGTVYPIIYNFYTPGINFNVGVVVGVIATTGATDNTITAQVEVGGKPFDFFGLFHN
jgi:hypothetical protein